MSGAASSPSGWQGSRYSQLPRLKNTAAPAGGPLSSIHAPISPNACHPGADAGRANRMFIESSFASSTQGGTTATRGHMPGSSAASNGKTDENAGDGEGDG